MTVKSKTDSNSSFTPDYNPLELERYIRRLWEQNRTRQKVEESRLKHNKGSLGFVEGPPTLNGMPHLGHARGRVMKDLRYRWKTMQGYYIPFWAGWDCQGLPVELEVEKLMGVKNKRDLLERVGQERFIQECKKVIEKYHQEWMKLDTLIGVFMNHDKAYWTYHDSYIDREWKYLKRAWEQGLMEEGHYVVAYCPGCQTSLSNAEVGYEDSYKLVEDPSLYFKFRATEAANEYFLVWTTMPFTLVTDTMLAVNPIAEYAKLRINDEIWIVVKSRVEPLMKELGIENYEIAETVIGSSLEGTKYEFPFVDLVPKQAELETKNPLVHRVILEDFVDVETATGVVHQSPGNGEEDFFAAQKRGVPIFSPFDDEVRFTEEAGAFAGKLARDADSVVIEELEKRGLLVDVKTIKHEYPTCWRSHHKLVWLARKEYFLRTDKINAKVLEAVAKTQFFYESPSNRFISFLKEGKPWCISRERVWGAPLPVWKCEKCQNKTIVSSKKELLERALEKPSLGFELHKPWVDEITLRCEKCEGIMRREDFVLDTWHNSGASPYARYTDDEFARFVPVDFLTEGIDQTRGWANSLLLEHIILTGESQSPYKSFLFQGLMQDAKGRKLGKSVGNVVDANKFLEEHSADVCRFYMMRKCSPEDFISFDTRELAKRPYQVLSTMYHLNRFLLQNAEFDRFQPDKHSFEWARQNGSLGKADLWLVSELQRLIQEYTGRLETCEFNVALAKLEDFVINTVSRLYVPMVRKELWTDESETLNRRLAVYSVLWRALKTVDLLVNPVTPYLSEALYQYVYRRLEPNLPETVNLENWPEYEESLRDETIEDEFKTMLDVVSLAYTARQSAKLKRRWPLRRMIVVGSESAIAKLKETEVLLLELSNIKAVEYKQEKPDYVSKDGWTSASEGKIQVFLEVGRDDALLGEGLMRDLARRVQALRKERGYVPTDVLESVHIAELDTDSIKLIRPYLAQMSELVRARRVHVHSSRTEIEMKWSEYVIDDRKVYVAMD